MRGLALALADAGFTVEMPLLPGHGTQIEDMLVDDVGGLVRPRPKRPTPNWPLAATGWWWWGCRWAAC